MTRAPSPSRAALALRAPDGSRLHLPVQDTRSGTDAAGAPDRRVTVLAGAEVVHALDADGLFFGQEAFRPPGSLLRLDEPAELELRLHADLAGELPDDARGLVPALVRRGGPCLEAGAWFLTRWRQGGDDWTPTFWADVTPAMEALAEPGALLAAAVPWLVASSGEDGPDEPLVRSALEAVLHLVDADRTEPEALLDTVAELVESAGGSPVRRTPDGTGLVFGVEGDTATWDCLVELADDVLTVSSLPRVQLPVGGGACELAVRLTGALRVAAVLLDPADGSVVVRSALPVAGAAPVADLVAALLTDNLDAVDLVTPALQAFAAGAPVEEALDALA